MSGWRHIEPDWVEPYYAKCGHTMGRGDLPCGATATDDWHDKRTWWQEPELWHAYVPTRCTCGHAIEEATR